jgi:hypothetical protein
MKNCAANAAHGQGRVGRRVAPGSTAVAFPDRNDGQQSFPVTNSWLPGFLLKMIGLF